MEITSDFIRGGREVFLRKRSEEHLQGGHFMCFACAAYTVSVLIFENMEIGKWPLSCTRKMLFLKYGAFTGYKFMCLCPMSKIRSFLKPVIYVESRITKFIFARHVIILRCGNDTRKTRLMIIIRHKKHLCNKH